MSIGVIDASTLDNLHATSLSDYAGYIPGFTVINSGSPGQASLGVRGISPLSAGSTVATYIDETPLGTSSNYGAGSNSVLDLLPYDLQSVELLRGPQGTLYGAGAMGGLLKYVTNEPSSYEFSGKVSLGGTLTRRGDPGNTQAAVINIPLKEDVAGLRVSAFRDHVGGYVDAVGPAAGSRINGGNTVGARVSLLVEPLAGLKIRLTGTQQDIKRDGTDFVDYDVNTGQPMHGGSTRQLSVREPYSVNVKVAAADIEYDFGWARLNSITSTQRSDFQQRLDYSAVYGPAVGLDTVIADSRSKLERTTQEFRLTSQSGGQFEWLAGLYFNREKGANRQTDTGVTEGDLLFADIPSNFHEKALYGDLTWNATPSISVTGGVRVARNSQDSVINGDGLLVGGPVTMTGDSAETSETYLLTARYALTPTSNVYARAASGYRPGGPNAVLRDPNGVALVPTMFEHDSLWSYEAGYKADLLDKSLSIQAAVYDIRWSQIQQYFAVNGVNVIVNAGRAHIQGAELSASYRATRQWNISGGLAYTDARLTEDAPGLASAGARLPNTPRFSANFATNYVFDLGGHTAYVGLSQRLVSSRNAGFDGSPALPQYKLPGYGLTDLQAGVDLERFQIALFVRNLFDSRAQIGAQTNLVAAGVGGPALVNEAKPFTIGTTLTARF